jgi:transposase
VAARRTGHGSHRTTPQEGFRRMATRSATGTSRPLIGIGDQSLRRALTAGEPERRRVEAGEKEAGRMHWIGFDVGKAFHWVCVLDDKGEEVLSRRVGATEEDLEAACSQIEALGEDRAVGIDLRGGPATLLEAVLIERGEEVFHVPGIAVNRARDAYPGESKSDARDARVIADQLRLRRGALQQIRPRNGVLAEMRVLVAHRRDLLQDQTRRAARLREVLLSVFPGLEAQLDLKREGALVVVTKVATPTAARRLGAARLFRWLKARGVRKAEDLAERVVTAAKAQHRELPAAEAKSALVAEIASEMLRSKERIAELDRRLEELLAASPEAEIVKSLPGMGVVFTAEFLAEASDLGRFASADSLAAAAGIAPVLRASGARSFQRRARRGNKVLKRVLYRSAFSCISHHGRSEVLPFYRRKRAEGKGHHQAVIALARRRVNVLWAMLRDGETYREQPAQTA